MAERKHKLRKLDAGDYLLLSNDAKTCWRIARYEEAPGGPVPISDWPRDIERWGVWRWPEQIVLGETGIETSTLDRWKFVGSSGRRRDAIDLALEQGQEGR